MDLISRCFPLQYVSREEPFKEARVGKARRRPVIKDLFLLLQIVYSQTVYYIYIYILHTDLYIEKDSFYSFTYI